MSVRLLLTLALFMGPFLDSLGGNAHADDFDVAVPYLPGRIDIGQGDPISEFILNHVGASVMTLRGDLGLLARTVEQNSDGLVWRVSVWPNLIFLSEARLRAANVVEHLNRLRDGQVSDLDDGIIKSLGNIKSVEVVAVEAASNPEVEIRLAQPDEGLARVLALPILDWRVVEARAQFIGEGTFLPTAGPFTVREHRPGVRTILERTGAYPRTITLRVFDDAQRALGALRGGSVDLILFPSRALIEDVKEDFTIESKQIVSRSDYRAGALRLPVTNWKSEERQGNEDIDAFAYIKRRSFDLGKEDRFFSLAYAFYSVP